MLLELKYYRTKINRIHESRGEGLFLGSGREKNNPGMVRTLLKLYHWASKIHRLREKRAACNICCCTGAICQSTAVTSSIALAWLSGQTTIRTCLVAVVPNAHALQRSGRLTQSPSSCHSRAGNLLFFCLPCKFLSYPLHLFLIVYLPFPFLPLAIPFPRSHTISQGYPLDI